MKYFSHGSVKVWVSGFIVAGLTAGAVVWYLAFRDGIPDFVAAGGTILVYEVDERGRPQSDEPGVRDALLVEALQRRMHDNGLGQVTVLAAGKGRVEFRIARTGHHEKDVERVKEIVIPVGRLEFRVLANAADDAKGQDAASQVIAAAADELAFRAKEGLLPPGPMQPNDRRPATFPIVLPNNSKSTVSYNWVELGPHERVRLNLDSQAGKDPARNAIWLQAQAKLNQATKLSEENGRRQLMQGALFFVRTCANRNLTEKERLDKQIDVFVLARDPEFDPADPAQTRQVPTMDGSYLTSASAKMSHDRRPAVSFTFNSEGATLFGNLTRKNVPDPEGPREPMRRHLAIILDGLVLSAPTIMSEIRTGGQISGIFTQQEVDAMVAILRGGSLPASLKPQPLSETAVPPASRAP